MGPSSLLRIRINSYTFGTPDASGTKDAFFLPELLRWWSPDGSPSSSWDESPDLSLIHPWNGYLKYPDSTHVYFPSNTQMPRTKQWYPGTTRRPLLLGLPLQAWSCGWPPQVLSCTLGSCCPILFLPWPNRRLVGQIEGTIVCKTFPNGFLGSTEWTESGRLNVAWRSKSNFAKLESLLKAAVLRVCGGQSWTYLQLFLLSQESKPRLCKQWQHWWYFKSFWVIWVTAYFSCLCLSLRCCMHLSRAARFEACCKVWWPHGAEKTGPEPRCLRRNPPSGNLT